MIVTPGYKIRKIRELKSLTQEYLSDKLNISSRAYSKIESGETELTIKRLNEIGGILEISSIEILEFNEKQILNRNKKSNIYNNFPVKLIGLYESRIEELEEQLKNK